MFEHVMLTGSPKGKRVWTTCAGVTGQVLLVAGMVVAPMLWPEVMPQATFTMLVPTAPPGRPAKADPEAKPQPRPAPVRKKFRPVPNALYQPISVPTTIEVLKYPEEPIGPVGVVGVPFADPNGSTNAFMRQIIGGGPAKPREADAEPRTDVVKPVAAVIPRVREGGQVKPARLVNWVEPQYPHLAVVSHVEGVVRLTGVIAVDGHISELAVESGNPLLVPAAMAAVRQWRYAATQLNGEPVEVVTSIVVTFKLNR